MKSVQFYLLAAIWTFTIPAWADACFFSNECNDSQVCINLECQSPDIAANVCERNYDCDELRTCVQGVCKPVGIYCSSEKGGGIVATSSAEYDCVDNSGWGHYLGAPGFNGVCSNVDVDCHLDYFSQLDETALRQLFDDCTLELTECLEAEPEEEEEDCPIRKKSLCIQWLTFDNNSREACGNDDIVRDNVDMMDNCCYWDTNEEVEAYQSFMDCVDDVEPADCVGVATCYSSASPQTIGTDDTDDTSAANGENSALDISSDGSSDGSSNSGCSFFVPGDFANSILRILL